MQLFKDDNVSSSDPPNDFFLKCRRSRIDSPRLDPECKTAGGPKSNQLARRDRQQNNRISTSKSQKRNAQIVIQNPWDFFFLSISFRSSNNVDVQNRLRRDGDLNL